MIYSKIRINFYLTLIFLLIISVYFFSSITPIIIVPILLISYYKIIVKKDFTVIIILMLMARCVMGPFIPGNAVSFNILNILCNYLPICIYFLLNIKGLYLIDINQINSLKWTFLYGIALVLLSLININYSLSIFPREVLPILLFLAIFIFKTKVNIDFDFLLNFFRYTFLASLIVYIIPGYSTVLSSLFSNAIIFKEEVVSMPIFAIGLFVPRNAGFIFDYRTLAQFSVIYFLILYYRGKSKSFRDLLLLSLVAITTFSRGPIVILIAVAIGAYGTKIKLTKKNIIFGFLSVFILLTSIIVALQNKKFVDYLETYSLFSKEKDRKSVV